MKIGILTKPEDSSPKVLAHSLQEMLNQLGEEAKIYDQGCSMLHRLMPLSASTRSRARLHFRLRQKLRFWRADRKLIRQLHQCDAIVLCDCIPNVFWKGYYDVERLRRFLPGKPVLLYAVFYLENAPTQVEKLRRDGDFGAGRYDGHLSVSASTEIRSKNNAAWAPIGIDLRKTGLLPGPKQDFTVLVDFAQPGFETHRQVQLDALREAGIKSIVLSGYYTSEEIRSIYRRASVFLLASSESFGLSIAECLAAGAYIFTAKSGWPISWRLDENPQVGGPGILPDVFITYKDKEDLKERLCALRRSYLPQKHPYQVFECFRRTYPQFYEGDLRELKSVITRLKTGPPCPTRRPSRNNP